MTVDEAKVYVQQAVDAALEAFQDPDSEDLKVRLSRLFGCSPNDIKAAEDGTITVPEKVLIRYVSRDPEPARSRPALWCPKCGWKQELVEPRWNDETARFEVDFGRTPEEANPGAAWPTYDAWVDAGYPPCPSCNTDLKVT